MGLCQSTCGHIHAWIHPKTSRPPPPPIAKETTTCTSTDTTPHLRRQIAEAEANGQVPTTRRTWHKMDPTNRRGHSLLCPGGGHHRPRRPINTSIRADNSDHNNKWQGRATARLSCHTSKCDDLISCIENTAQHALRRIIPFRERRTKQSSGLFFPPRSPVKR